METHVPPSKAIKLIKASDVKFMGDKVVVVLDPVRDTFGDSPILRAESVTQRLPIGTVVAHGVAIDPERAKFMKPGVRIFFNRSGAEVSDFEIDGVAIELWTLSSRDVFAVNL